MDRVQRKYGSLTDEQVLELLIGGHVWIVGNTAYGQSGPLREERCHRGYRFVRIYFEGARRRIAVHKLIWMASRGATVPPGAEIHHKHGRYREFDDDLQLLTYDGHQAAHREPGDDEECPF